MPTEEEQIPRFPDIKRFDSPYKMPGTNLMTRTQKKINEFLHNRGFTYRFNFEIKGHILDFVVFDENAEIYLAITREENLPDDLVYVIPWHLQYYDKQDIEEILSGICEAYGFSYEEMVSDLIESMPVEFPYKVYTEDQLKKDFENLKNVTGTITKNSNGMKLVLNFHKSIWSAKVCGGISPYEAWHNPELLEKCIRNRIIYKDKLTPENIARGFDMNYIAMRVSVFSPALAKSILDKYTTPNEIEVYDPFSGFSGRLLGAMAAGKHYTGADLSPVAVKESNEIIRFMGFKDAIVKEQDILAMDPVETDICFTCSPYGLTETWGMNIQDKTCDEWIDVCLEKIKAKVYIFVVNSTEKYKDRIAEGIDNKSHISKSKESILIFK